MLVYDFYVNRLCISMAMPWKTSSTLMLFFALVSTNLAPILSAIACPSLFSTARSASKSHLVAAMAMMTC